MVRRPYKFWTESELLWLKQAWESGKPVSEIAAESVEGRSPDAILRKALDMGLGARQPKITSLIQRKRPDYMPEERWATIQKMQRIYTEIQRAYSKK
jgi:hypothetical protein